MFFLVGGVGRNKEGRNKEGRGVNTVVELVEIRVRGCRSRTTCYYSKIKLQFDMSVLVFPLQ